MGRFEYLVSVTEDPDPSDSVIEDQPVTFDIVENIPTEFKGRINLSHLI